MLLEAVLEEDDVRRSARVVVVPPSRLRSVYIPSIPFCFAYAYSRHDIIHKHFRFDTRLWGEKEGKRETKSINGQSDLKHSGNAFVAFCASDAMGQGY